MRITIESQVGDQANTTEIRIPNWLIVVGLIAAEAISYNRSRTRTAKVYVSK